MPPTQPKRIRGDGRIYRRGDFYWCAFYVDGKQQRESCHTQDAAKAEKYLQRRRNQARAHELDPSMAFITRRAHKRTVGELMDALEKHFKAEDQLSAPTLSNINRVRKDFGARRATTLTASEVNSYIEERSKAGDANATINRATQILKQSYRLSGLRLPGPEPINHLDESGNVRQGFFTDPEIRRVLEHLSEDLADFVLFGWCTGTRRGEIAALLWSDVQDDCIYVPAEITKTGKAHVIPLVGELAELIERRKVARLIKRNGSVTFASHIFHRDGAPIIEFRKSWHSACIAAGLGKWVCPSCVGQKATENEGRHVYELDAKSTCPRCNKRWKSEEKKYSGRIFHDLRRSAVRDMVNAGVPEADAMNISGHSSASMFGRYNIRDTDDARRALERVQAHRKTVREKVVAMAAD